MLAVRAVCHYLKSDYTELPVG